MLSFSKQTVPFFCLALYFGEHNLQFCLVRRKTPCAFVHLHFAAKFAVDDRLPTDRDKQACRLELDVDVFLACSGRFYGEPHMNSLVLLAPIPLAISSFLFSVVVLALASAFASTHAAHASHHVTHATHATSLATAFAQHGHQRGHVHTAGTATASATSHASHHLLQPGHVRSATITFAVCDISVGILAVDLGDLWLLHNCHI
mmetsp:Transcript_66226/g.130485  ORF Transcript_66226/g.130485 Transcript_66226/m.130485 type:complete len:203 (-) Transcript_66226:48-656(-)